MRQTFLGALNTDDICSIKTPIMPGMPEEQIQAVTGITVRTVEICNTYTLCIPEGKDRVKLRRNKNRDIRKLFSGFRLHTDSVVEIFSKTQNKKA